MSAVEKSVAQARALRGLQQRAKGLMRLRCSRLRHAGLARRAEAWVRRDRKAEQRQRYVERRVKECEQEAAAEDAQAAAMFSTLSKGLQVTLLEPQEQPPPACEAPTGDVNVSDPPEIIAAHAAAAALDDASAYAVKAAAARKKADQDKRAVTEAKTTYQRLAAEAQPFFTMRRAGNNTSINPKVFAATEARVDWEKVDCDASLTDALASQAESENYRRTYALLGSVEADVEELKRKHGGAEGFKLIEKMVASCKAHRNIVDIEVTFLNNS